MKTTGICPKCSGTEIYTDADLTKRGDRGDIGISSWTRLFLDVYVCATCGFIEEYVRNNDLTDDKKIATLKENWKSHKV